MKSIITLAFVLFSILTISAQEIYELKFTAGTTVHRAALVMNDDFKSKYLSYIIKFSC